MLNKLKRGIKKVFHVKTKTTSFKGFKIIKTKPPLVSSTYLDFYKNNQRVVEMRYSPQNKKVVYVARMKSHNRKKGMGTDAMKYFLQKMKQNGKNKVVLVFNPWDDVQRTAEFLTKFGFKASGSTFANIELKGLQKLDVRNLPRLKPDKKEAKRIVDHYMTMNKAVYLG